MTNIVIIELIYILYLFVTLTTIVNHFLYVRLLMHNFDRLSLFAIRHLLIEIVHYLFQTVGLFKNIFQRSFTSTKFLLINFTSFQTLTAIKVLPLPMLLQNNTVAMILVLLTQALTRIHRRLFHSYFLPQFFLLLAFIHNITQRLFEMREEPPINRQLFSDKIRNNRIDEPRIDYFKKIQSAQQSQKPEEKIKKVINPNMFRQEVRRQQRDFRQNNHEFLKMCGIISRSSRDQTKFGYIGESHRKTNNFSKGNTNAKNAQRKAAEVHLSLDTTQFSCSLLTEKIPIKDVYQLFPFRKDSIIFQSEEYLSSEFIFFFYQNQNAVADNLKYKLEQTIEEGILAEFKSSINKNFKHVGFFDYLYFINRKPPKQQPKQQSKQQSKQAKKQEEQLVHLVKTVIKSDKEPNYPNYLIQIANANTGFLSKLDEDEKSKYNHDEISVYEQQTCQRLLICQQTDVVDNGENLCFDTIQEYTDYKKYKAINFKNQKIFEKDAIINTNIRNIISTQKIYLVEIIEEVKSYIELSQECQGTGIMNKVYEQITSKADQYLRLLCGYTESKILTVYNIQNYQEKIYSFIEKSIRYKKQIKNLPLAVIKEFPVLQIWYKIPENLLGYDREELHDTFYRLMEAIIVFEQKMKASEFYDSLKIKRPGIKYLK